MYFTFLYVPTWMNANYLILDLNSTNNEDINFKEVEQVETSNVITNLSIRKRKKNRQSCSSKLRLEKLVVLHQQQNLWVLPKKNIKENCSFISTFPSGCHVFPDVFHQLKLPLNVLKFLAWWNNKTKRRKPLEK